MNRVQRPSLISIRHQLNINAGVNKIFNMLLFKIYDYIMECSETIVQRPDEDNLTYIDALSAKD